MLVALHQLAKDAKEYMMKKERTPLTERLMAHGNNFTASDTLIADYLLNNYPKSLMQNASEVSEMVAVNVATVTRFFMKLGYSSAKEAMVDFKEELEFIIDGPTNRYGDTGATKGAYSEEVAKILELEQSNISGTLGNIDMTTLRSVLELLIDENRKIFIIGTMKEYSLAYYLYKQLLSSRRSVYIFRGPNIADFMCEVDSNSVCVVMDFRRYARPNIQVAKRAKAAGATVIAFTDSLFSPTALLADHQFIVATKSATMFDSYTAGMALINVIMMLLISFNGGNFKDRLETMEANYSAFNLFSSQ